MYFVVFVADMMRNAEYVLALKDLMNVPRGSTSIVDYRKAFDRLDTDKSGYIEVSEVQALLEHAYGNNNNYNNSNNKSSDTTNADINRRRTTNKIQSQYNVPRFEIEAFLSYFDANHDGKISWDEFERGLGRVVATNETAEKSERLRKILGTLLDDDDVDDDEDEDDNDVEIDDYDDDLALVEADIDGIIEVELDNGKVIELEAKEYVDSLRREVKLLKSALRKEKLGHDAEQIGGGSGSGSGSGLATSPSVSNDITGELSEIAAYISHRQKTAQGDMQKLTQGIQPEIVETMKLLVNFVLAGGEGQRMKNLPPEEMQLEIPSSALQQLALWQLILGYRLREAEAKGDYLKLLE
jgi:Ca2+-binding EF-hand superfamily protein